MNTDTTSTEEAQTETPHWLNEILHWTPVQVAGTLTVITFGLWILKYMVIHFAGVVNGCKQVKYAWDM